MDPLLILGGSCRLPPFPEPDLFLEVYPYSGIPCMFLLEKSSQSLLVVFVDIILQGTSAVGHIRPDKFRNRQLVATQCMV